MKVVLYYIKTLNFVEKKFTNILEYILICKAKHVDKNNLNEVYIFKKMVQVVILKKQIVIILSKIRF